MDALLYKIQNDPYYRDVQVDYNVVEELPEIAIDVSHLINYITLPEIDDETDFAMLQGIGGNDDILDGLETSSFAARLPNARREIDIIRSWANIHDSEENSINDASTDVINWLGNGSSSIDEYKIVGLFDMEFPALFPKGEAVWLQPRMRNVYLHEYAKHLIRYHDNIFGRHPHFRYF